MAAFYTCRCAKCVIAEQCPVGRGMDGCGERGVGVNSAAVPSMCMPRGNKTLAPGLRISVSSCTIMPLPDFSSPRHLISIEGVKTKQDCDVFVVSFLFKNIYQSI